MRIFKAFDVCRAGVLSAALLTSLCMPAGEALAQNTHSVPGTAIKCLDGSKDGCIQEASSKDAEILVDGALALQGACDKEKIGDEVDREWTNSVVSCPGTSNKQLNFAYPAGLTESCVYIDNASPSSYFVPMRTQEEWQKFKEATATGKSLAEQVSITYGCAATARADSCNNQFEIPEGRNGAEYVARSSNGSTTTTFVCQATSGCGQWVQVSTSGTCSSCSTTEVVGTEERNCPEGMEGKITVRKTRMCSDNYGRQPVGLESRTASDGSQCTCSVLEQEVANTCKPVTACSSELVAQDDHYYVYTRGYAMAGNFRSLSTPREDTIDPNTFVSGSRFGSGINVRHISGIGAYIEAGYTEEEWNTAAAGPRRTNLVPVYVPVTANDKGRGSIISFTQPTYLDGTPVPKMLLWREKGAFKIVGTGNTTDLANTFGGRTTGDDRRCQNIVECSFWGGTPFRTVIKFNYTIADACKTSTATVVVDLTMVYSPLVLDLDGDGLDVIGLENSRAAMDIDLDGVRDHIGWIGPQDGLLVLDKNGNGRVDNRTELFGDKGNENPDGFSNLGTYDENKDGVINSADAVYARLLVWRDADGDSVAAKGELVSLSDAGVDSISLKASEVEKLVNGQMITHESSFTRRDGTKGGIYDLWFSYEPLQ